MSKIYIALDYFKIENEDEKEEVFTVLEYEIDKAHEFEAVKTFSSEQELLNYISTNKNIDHIMTDKNSFTSLTKETINILKELQTINFY